MLFMITSTPDYCNMRHVGLALKSIWKLQLGQIAVAPLQSIPLSTSFPTTGGR